MYKWIVFFLLMGLSGCSQRIISYVNPKASFRSFETFRVVSPKLDNKLSSESNGVYELIRENIGAEMSRRNYVESSVSPHLTLRYELASSTRVETNNNQQPFGFQTWPVNSRTIHEAVLLFELFDQRKKLVWQGSYDLNQERKEKRVKKVITNAVGKIFTTYPYRALQQSPDESLTEFNRR